MDIKAIGAVKQKPIEVFCCYAHEDQRLLLKLKTHLTPLQREGLITLWADVNINAGIEWEKEIDRHLYAARIILLLISPDFMASEYCYSVEMQRAMERHERGEARVIPIILRPVSWQGAPFGKLQVLPTGAEPITSGKRHHQDEAFCAVAKGIRDVIETLERKNTDSKASEVSEVELPSANPRSELDFPDQIDGNVAKVPFSPTPAGTKESSLDEPPPPPSGPSPSKNQMVGVPCDVPRFEMSIYLVTNREFKEFLEAHPDWRFGKECRHVGEVDSNYLSHWLKDRTKYPPGKAKHPVVNISRYAAEAYAAWRGDQLGKVLRLPTKDEWETAARAENSSLDDALVEELNPKQVRVNYGHKEGGTTAVGEFEPNPYGFYYYSRT